MVQVGVARLVVWLETASGRDGRVGLDPAGGGADRANPRPIRSHPCCWRACRGSALFLGDTHYNDPEVRALASATGAWLRAWATRTASPMRMGGPADGLP